MGRLNKILTKGISSALVLGTTLSTLTACQPDLNKIPQEPENSYVETLPEDEQVNQEVNKEENQEQNKEEDKEENKQEVDKYASYPSSEYVKTLCDALDAKSDYIFEYDWYHHDNVTRFTHGNGEPITIAFAPSVSDQCEEVGKEVCEYLFNIINQVNDQYFYEFTEYDENNPADITFNTRMLAVAGCISRVESDRMGYGEHFVSKATINVNELGHSQNFGQYNDKQKDDLWNTLLHEMLHIFGLADVYLDRTLEHDATTFLKNSHSNMKILHTQITPNDYKNLIACYFKPSGDIERDIEVCKQLVDEYCKHYYKDWTNEYFETKKAPTKSVKDGVYIFTRNIYVDQTRNDQVSVTFNLTVQGNQFSLMVFNQEGNLIEEDSGKIKYLSMKNQDKTVSNAIAVMQLVECKSIFEDIKTGVNTNTGFLDLILFESDGQYVLKDFIGAINSAKLTYREIEKEAEQE